MTVQPARRTFGRRREMPTVTIRHGGGETAFTIRPWIAIAGLGTLATFGTLYLGATAYLMFHDEILGAAVRHQMQIESAYEDRIAALRLQIDRISSKQLLEQDSVEAKVDALLKQQKALQDAGSRFTGLIDKARAHGVVLPEAALPKTTELKLPAPVKSAAWLGSLMPAPRAEAPIGDRVAAAEEAIRQTVQSQAVLAESISAVASGELRKIETSVARLGVAGFSTKPAKVAEAKGGVGGPFVPDLSDPLASFARAEATLARLEAARQRIVVLPLRRPLAGEMTVTSSFGSRVDPFLGVGAIHTGVDFRADTGTPILATAPGTVDEAGRQGGYGLMVDVDHGGGISTRYGHLSQLAVAAGTKVAAGDIIGYAGSTGRSTGPHLHYETRINGQAVDPTDWLDVGGDLRSFLN